ncbi:MAG TPA: hypothetical protein VIY56_12140 [Vicinamibacterales bacterium]
MMVRLVASAVLLLVSQLASVPLVGAELQNRTVAAFDRYVRATEALASGAGPFLWIDGLPDAERRARLDMVAKGGLVIEPLTTRENGRAIDVPGGMIHHWMGAVFVPKATVNQAVALLQDYDAHEVIYKPAVARSRTLAREGDAFRVHLRFYMKKVITVIVNSEHEARFVRTGADRAQSRIQSVRIAEVENPDTPSERELPVGNDGGYLWRLYTYWRFLERDGGTYLQCEAISLTRGIPLGFGWLIGPFVTSIPRESLTFTLETTRTTLARQGL